MNDNDQETTLTRDGQPIETLDELEEGGTYHYIASQASDDAATFTINRRYEDSDDFAGYGEGAIQFQYRDGYVANLPVSKVEKQIKNGRIAKGEA